MKSLICLVALLSTAAAFDFYRLASAEWESYKAEYGKTYDSKAMEHVHMTEFLESKRVIAEHNARYHKGEVSYLLGITQHSDMLPSQLTETRLGLKLPADYKRTGYTFIAPADHVTLPKSIDWRAKGAVTPAKDQQKCGSCWAFSVTGALEGQNFRKTKKLVSLSEQQLVDCDLKDQGCSGGIMDDGFNYVKKNGGVDTEESYPYRGDDGMCAFNNKTIGATDLGYVDIKGGEAEMMKAVATIGPISVGIFANLKTFFEYKSGIYNDPNCNTGGDIDHGVLLVGYGTSDDGKDYWILKNSWGAAWGENGFMKLAKGINLCLVSSIPSYPLV